MEEKNQWFMKVSTQAREFKAPRPGPPVHVPNSIAPSGSPCVVEVGERPVAKKIKSKINGQPAFIDPQSVNANGVRCCGVR
jgi:hypothetical protein